MDALVNINEKTNILNLPSLQTTNRAQQSQSPMMSKSSSPTLAPPNMPSTTTPTQNVLNAVLNLPQTFNNLRTLNNLTKSFTQNGSPTVIPNGDISEQFPDISKIVKEEIESENKDEKNGTYVKLDDFFTNIQLEILPESVLKFEFDKPDEPSGEQRSYEIASRMLFLSARWIKNFCSVHSIDAELQIKFMLHTWSELFLIGISQCCTKDDLKYIFETLR